MQLAKLPRDDFHRYLTERLAGPFPDSHDELADRILDYNSDRYELEDPFFKAWLLTNQGEPPPQ